MKTIYVFMGFFNMKTTLNQCITIAFIFFPQTKLRLKFSNKHEMQLTRMNIPPRTNDSDTITVSYIKCVHVRIRFIFRSPESLR